MTRREFVAGLSGVLASTGISSAASMEPAYAAFVPSPIACGQLRGLELAASRAMPEVLAALRTIRDDTIDYLDQPLALIVATQKEAAIEAARRCVVSYESQPAILTTAAALQSAYVPAKNDELSVERGSVEVALFESQTRLAAQAGIVRSTYRTAPEIFQVLPSPVVVELLAQAERAVQRKVVMAQPSLFAQRPETIQTLTLQAGRDGKLHVLLHNTLNETAMRDEYIEPCGILSAHLYSVDNLRTSHKLVRKNIAPRGSAELRSRGTLPGLFALESALDELSHLWRIDPLRLRLFNHAELDEPTQKPWIEKRLRECYRVGSDRIGWSSRTSEPRTQREGNFFVGLGMASTMSTPRLVTLDHMGEHMEALFGAHFARVTVEPNKAEARVVRLVTVLDLPESPKLLAAAKQGVAYALRTLFSDGNKAAASTEIDIVVPEASLSQSAPQNAAPSESVVRDVAASGVAAAVANALHNASGIRYRELPIRLLQMVV